MTEPIVRVDAILFEALQPLELARFYRDAFGLSEPRWYGQDHVGLRAANTYLGFDRVAELPETRRTVSVWFRVRDVPAMSNHLQRLGATVKLAPEWERGTGEALARLLDPEGNEVGLVGPSPEAALGA